MAIESQFSAQAQAVLDANPDVEVIYSTEDGNLFLRHDWAQAYARLTAKQIVEYRRQPGEDDNADNVPLKNSKKK